MSTKIYRAWRCVASRHLNNFLQAYRTACIDSAVNRLTASLQNQHIRNYNENLTAHNKRQQRQKVENAVREFLGKSVAASRSLERNPYCDIDASLNVWIIGPHAMIIPYTELPVFTSRLPYGVQDFSYWDNTNKPEDISKARWTARGKRWDVVLDNWDTGRLVYIAIEAKTGKGLEAIVQKACPFISVHNALPEDI